MLTGLCNAYRGYRRALLYSGCQRRAGLRDDGLPPCSYLPVVEDILCLLPASVVLLAAFRNACSPFRAGVTYHCTLAEQSEQSSMARCDCSEASEASLHTIEDEVHVRGPLRLFWCSLWQRTLLDACHAFIPVMSLHPSCSQCMPRCVCCMVVLA